MYRNIISSAILAGVCIAMGGTVFLKVGGVEGAVLFSFGLVTVVSYKLKLYTGTAGFFLKGEFLQLLEILLLNIIGCLITAQLIRYSSPDCVDKAGTILQARLEKGPLACGILGIGCGFIMTTAVCFARRGQMLPLIFGVPLFIMCGFTHCIADAFYYLAAPLEMLSADWARILAVYISIVIGNFVGCNLYRVVMPKELQV